MVHRPDLDFSLNFQIGLPGGTAAGGLVLVDCRLFALNQYGIWVLCGQKGTYAK